MAKRKRDEMCTQPGETIERLKRLRSIESRTQKIRELTRMPLRPNPFFDHLTQDVRMLIYDQMGLPPLENGEKWSGLFLACHQAKMEMEDAAKHALLKEVKIVKKYLEEQGEGSARALLSREDSNVGSKTEGLSALGIELYREPDGSTEHVLISHKIFRRCQYFETYPRTSPRDDSESTPALDLIYAVLLSLNISKSNMFSTRKDTVVSWKSLGHKKEVRLWEDAILVGFVRNVFPHRAIRLTDSVWNSSREQELQARWEQVQGSDWSDSVFAVRSKRGWLAMTFHSTQVSQN
ncbi:hypothetical protein K491DRAFT_719478 [Lophiostoma macrostomum CBS 122681]|uniref:Uncharacterized protein n=1 Tax=Lophiostoma macrostomum CBS 122681 TaxID=1314788 RepID=A0A6A6SZ89_9PLEO|nr:hypothetical protein K491DRAFT_719478 [Lophiostoma macrostomum CBS 122681]